MNNFRPYRFEILPQVVKNLLIINGLIFFAQITFGAALEDFFNQYLALHSIKSDYFKAYQLLTYLFLHNDFGHLLYNMFPLWMFGAVLENMWGAKRFIKFYFFCGIGAGITQIIVLWFEHQHLINTLKQIYLQVPTQLYENASIGLQRHLNVATVGASGAIFGLLAAFGFLFPNQYIYVYFLLPVKIKWFVTVYMLIEVAFIFMDTNDGVARFAHLGGAFIALTILLIERKMRKPLI